MIRFKINRGNSNSFRLSVNTNRGGGGGGISSIDITVNDQTYDTATSSPFDVDVENTAGTDLGSLVGSVWTIADITVTDSDGSTTTQAAGTDVTCTPQVKSLFTKFTLLASYDTSDTFTIDADSAGTYTSISDDGSSGTITIDVNGGGFAAFSNPLVLAVSDTIRVKRTTATANGFVKITGTYV